jgi:hypothetical protein
MKLARWYFNVALFAGFAGAASDRLLAGTPYGFLVLGKPDVKMDPSREPLRSILFGAGVICSGLVLRRRSRPRP